MTDCPPLLAISSKALPSKHGFADWHWRVQRPFARLAEQGADVATCWLNEDERPTISPYGRLVILQRVVKHGTPDEVAAWVESLRDAGTLAVVFEIDDDEISPACIDWMRQAGGLESVGIARLEAERLALVNTLRACDAVTVSTEPLAEVVRQYTDRPVYVVPNAIDVAWFRDRLAARPAWADHLTIGWAGGRRPDADIEPMAVAWGRIARHHPQVRFVVAGWQPDCIYREVDDIDRIVRLPWQALDDYPRAYQVDIGCTPLAMSDFNRCKSPIKAWEYGLAGAAVVASPTVYGDCRRLIDPGPDSADAWTCILDTLVSDAYIRRGNGWYRAHVEEHHALATSLHRWTDAYREIAARVGAMV